MNASRRIFLRNFSSLAGGLLISQPHSNAQTSNPRRIDVHHHFTPPAYLAFLKAHNQSATEFSQAGAALSPAPMPAGLWPKTSKTSTEAERLQRSFPSPPQDSTSEHRRNGAKSSASAINTPPDCSQIIRAGSEASLPSILRTLSVRCMRSNTLLMC